MWALDVRDTLYHSSYVEFRNPAQAVKWIMNKYPDKQINLSIRSIDWYHKEMSDLPDTISV